MLVTGGIMRRIFLVGHHPGFRAALARTIQDQSQRTLGVVGDSIWGSDTLDTIKIVRPHVVILVVGFAASRELGIVASIHRLAPACQVLVIDALGDASLWPAGGWSQADALLRSEQLATELVPTIRQLVAQRSAVTSAPHGICLPSALLE